MSGPSSEGDRDASSRGADRPSTIQRVKLFLFGKPRDLADKSVFHKLSLIPILAWVGLGADGLSSSCYGPEEVFRNIGGHNYLAVALAMMMIFTVLLISSSYAHIIEEFPHGGGGYVVAGKILGPSVGVVSGSALLVDYMHTIAVSLAATGDAIFSFLPHHWIAYKLPVEIALVVLLTTLNIRGVKESVLVLAPIFMVFLLTHLVLICGGIGAHFGSIPETVTYVEQGFAEGSVNPGGIALLFLFMRAYSLGGGTYTGIEAVSNGLPIMREPKVKTGKRTMLYMALSLSFASAGLLICYLLWNVQPVEGKTMNAVLLERFTANWGSIAGFFVITTLLAEGLLLVVAAQAGFLDGPRVLANMAVDSYVPNRYAALSERLTARNGILLMGGSAIALLLYTKGDLRHLVLVYAINVYITFSLSMLSMTKLMWKERKTRKLWKQRFFQFAVSFLLCASILVVTMAEKFMEGGWLTFVMTGSIVTLAFLIKAHYTKTGAKLNDLYKSLDKVPAVAEKENVAPDPTQNTAIVLVGGYGGVGIHTVLNIFKNFSRHYKNLVFLSVGVIDSGIFKGEETLADLRFQTFESLEKYMNLARWLGVPASYRYAIGTDAVDEAVKLCLDTASEFSSSTFFAGKLIFERERWYHRLLHNGTAQAIEKRLQERGKTVVVLPATVE